MIHVLIIEDTTDVAHLLQVVLGADDELLVDTRTDNFGAIRHDVDWNGVDAVLCDQYLDGYDGKQILEWLSVEHPRIKRVMLTGDSSVDLSGSFADAVLIKPTPPADILDVLKSSRSHAATAGP